MLNLVNGITIGFELVSSEVFSCKLAVASRFDISPVVLIHILYFVVNIDRSRNAPLNEKLYFAVIRVSKFTVGFCLAVRMVAIDYLIICKLNLIGLVFNESSGTNKE